MDNDVTRDFNRDAATWDDNPGRVMNARAITEAIRRRIPLSAAMDALDYGAGTGLVTLALSPFARRVVAADSAPGMLARLSEKATAAGLTNVGTLVLDLECDPVPEQRFDLIVSTMTLHHIADAPRAVAGLCRMLKPGGFLALADIDLDDGEFHANHAGVHHNGFDRDEMRRFFQENGLTDITVETASTVTKPVAGKGLRDFTVFLAAGRMPG